MQTANTKIDLTTPPFTISKKVAMVGNSDILLNKEFGHEIDKYDTVVRFNLARIMGKYSGTKTTVRVFGGPIGFGQFNEAKYGVKNDAERKNELRKMTNNCTVLVTSKDLENELKRINPKIKCHYLNALQLYSQCNKLLSKLGIAKRFESKTGCARTGFVILLILVSSGIIPHLYGFDWEKRKGYKHYYGTEIRNTVNNVRHEEVTEVEIIAELEKKGLIVIHK